MKPSKKPSEAWKASYLASLKTATNKGDYKGALVLAKRGLALYPDEFVCRFQYAKLLGDHADELPPARKRRLKREAAAVLKPLLRKMSGVPVGIRFGACLNYYYQTEKFAQMYRFGRRFERTDRQRAYYAQGIASGLIAQALREKGRLEPSRMWAEKSARAWSRYDLAGERYYFAHYSYAKALALAGRPREALKKLKRAAKLAARPLEDWEFADVLELIQHQRSG